MATSYNNPLYDGLALPTGLGQETRLLEGDIKQQKKIGTGYFEAACTLSILLFIGMAVLLGLTLMDIDKCETHQSPHCPYFTNPQPNARINGSNGGPGGNAGSGGDGANNLAGYYTHAKLPNGDSILINPDPYPKQ